MRVLFVCNMNMHRSKTAEEIFAKQFETRSKGLYRNPVQEEDILWANTVCVVEEWQRQELAQRFPKAYLQKRILCLDIPNIYGYMQPKLVELLQKKSAELLEPLEELQ